MPRRARSRAVRGPAGAWRGGATPPRVPPRTGSRRCGAKSGRPRSRCTPARPRLRRRPWSPVSRPDVPGPSRRPARASGRVPGRSRRSLLLQGGPRLGHDPCQTRLRSIGKATQARPATAPRCASRWWHRGDGPRRRLPGRCGVEYGYRVRGVNDPPGAAFAGRPRPTEVTRKVAGSPRRASGRGTASRRRRIAGRSRLPAGAARDYDD